MQKAPTSSAPRLTRETVLRAALELLNEVGIDALSTRRLAERLGVQSPTLYWHFKSKNALLHAMSEAILLERHRDSLPKRGQSWRSWLAANTHSFRRALLAYRDGARLHAGTRPRGAHFDAIEAKLRFLCDAGFSPDQALTVLVTFGSFILGWVLEEQADEKMNAPASAAEATLDAATHPLMAHAWGKFNDQDPDKAFDNSIKIMLDGVAAMLQSKA
ncbi:tetracycline resistance transcriptional repressor TetR [Trinickia fusca]|uniref:TetR family transcriptional regulator n=1 Tax=Trinickia fusca TaxID=2419777 RepID=A0A494WXM7_9BURK|nr:tetracycline resistance transcriptional repressor TetR [Trinickia fusca]RKP43285.1 TetR family transcriptional regulator [Trinickia fusca]